MKKSRKILPNLPAVRIEKYNETYAILVPPGEVIILISPGQKPFLLDEPPQDDAVIVRVGILCDDGDELEIPIFAITVKPDVAEDMKSRLIAVDAVVEDESVQVIH